VLLEWFAAGLIAAGLPSSSVRLGMAVLDLVLSGFLLG